MPRLIPRLPSVRPVALLAAAVLAVPFVRAPHAVADQVPVPAGAAANGVGSVVRVAAGPSEGTGVTTSSVPVAASTPGSAGVTARVLPVASSGASASTTTTARVASSGSGPVSVGTTVAPRYGDPVADLAKGALDAFADHLAQRRPTEAGTPDPKAVDPWAPRVVDQSWVAIPVEGITVGTLVQTRVAPAVQAALSALPTEPQSRYAAVLRQLARQAAERAKVDAARLEQVWLRTDPRRMWAVLSALSQVGTLYRWAGNEPGGFDCSGLTSWAWAQAGVRIPRTSIEQINAIAPRELDTLLPGDLSYRPGHISMYLGVGDATVAAPRTGKWVEVKRMGKVTRHGSPL